MKEKQDQFSIRTPEYLETFQPFRDSLSLSQIKNAVQDYVRDRIGSFICLDSMAGTGIVGRELKYIFERLQIIFQDKSEKMLNSFCYSNEDKRILSDAAATGIAGNTIDMVFCRVGLNNVGKGDYPKIMREYIRIMRNDGLGILQDHFAVSEGAKNVINKIETEVAKIEGRKDKTYIPTVGELGYLIRKAGGEIDNIQSIEIKFSLRDRFKSKGINNPDLSAISEILKGQDSIKYEEKDGDIFLVYPIITVTFQRV